MAIIDVVFSISSKNNFLSDSVLPLLLNSNYFLKKSTFFLAAYQCRIIMYLVNLFLSFTIRKNISNEVFDTKS